MTATPTVWFTADLHLLHGRIKDFHPTRPGDDVESMSEALVENWNAVVNRRDEVWVLGDLFLGPAAQAASWFARLKGSKHLIVGNHDSKAVKRLDWASVHDLHTWRLAPNSAVLCHYPLLTWDGAHRGRWMLHGHSHGLLQPSTTSRLDVGVDCHPEHRPFHVDEVTEIMETRSYVVVDAHRPSGS